MQVLRRQRTRDQIRELVRDMIVKGELPPGRRLDEIGLSTRIGASRTPVREALIALEEEGLVQSRPNHGFSVSRLDAQVVHEIYPILGALEAVALELGGDRTSALAPALSGINAKLLSEKRAARRYQLDRQFHRLLTDWSGNEQLAVLLARYRAQAERVDGGLHRGMADVQGSHVDHDAIVRAIAVGDICHAAHLLREHWRKGEQVVLRWMEQKR